MQRLLPPGPVSPATITANGRYYSCALGSTIDVPDQDAFIMLANGWIAAGASPTAEVGPTSARPTNPTADQSFFDSSLNKQIVFDGAFWCDPDTGASV